MSDVPLVSACLLTYKRAPVLPRTIGDLLAQTFKDFELVINDDKSPDDTERVCREFASQDSRIRYFRNTRNLRYAGNQNAAVSRARGKYIAFLHDGDRYSPHLLELWVQAMEAHPTAGLVFNAVNVLDSAGNIATGWDYDYAACTPGLDFYDHMLTTVHSPIFGIVMVRRSALLAAGNFDETLPVLADVDMWFRLLRNNDVAYVPERIYSIYPREADHPNAWVNWAIRDELTRIYRSACDRRYTPGSKPWRSTRRRVNWQLLKTDLKCLGSAAKRGRWDVFASGLPSVFMRHFSPARP